jgi:hypothetical protein
MDKIDRWHPLSRSQFDAELARWVAAAGSSDRIGDTSGRGQKAWIHVEADGRVYRLNADSTYFGVRDYLGMLAATPGLEWHVVENRNGRRNKIAFGERRRQIPGFYLYVVD